MSNHKGARRKHPVQPPQPRRMPDPTDLRVHPALRVLAAAQRELPAMLAAGYAENAAASRALAADPAGLMVPIMTVRFNPDGPAMTLQLVGPAGRQHLFDRDLCLGDEHEPAR